MEPQIFCDGIGRISVIGGLVRLDLFTFSPSETDANGSPRPILTHRIVMGTDGFLRSSEKVVEAVQMMGRAGQAPPQQQPQRPPQPQQMVAPKPAPQPVPPTATPPRTPETPPSRPPFP